MVIGEFKAFFVTKDFKTKKEAIEHLNETLFAKMKAEYVICTGFSGEMEIVDILDLMLYDNDEDDEEIKKIH